MGISACKISNKITKQSGHWFWSREARRKKCNSSRKKRMTFERCQLPENLDVITDSNGDGVRVKYPFIRLFLVKSQKTFNIVHWELQEHIANAGLEAFPWLKPTENFSVKTSFLIVYSLWVSIFSSWQISPSCLTSSALFLLLKPLTFLFLIHLSILSLSWEK